MKDQNCSQSYTVAGGYKWLLPPSPKVQWRYVCWNSLNLPRTSFIYWASRLQRLLTRDRIIEMGLVGMTHALRVHFAHETHGHLFYNCDFSTKCIRVLQQRLRISFPPQSFVQWYASGRERSKLQRKFVCACFVSLTYEIWHARNIARLQGQIVRPEVLVFKLINSIKQRWSKRNHHILTQRDQVWIDSVRN
ncbi:uncharacterized protein LOC141630573 [Silene latifolia]|uniref:uncharacterized protein LOC141630573 n=1 Tax=Silene latifolia TaxID=37657 RepID=UPI003D7750D9